MATNTKFQDIRAALSTAITTRWTTDTLTAVFTKYPPLGDYTREDRMWLGEIGFSQEPYSYAGNYQETMSVSFTVACPASGGSQDEWDDGVGRAEALLDSALTALRADITVGSTVFNVELGDTDNPVDQLDEHGPIGIVSGTFELEAHV